MPVWHEKTKAAREAGKLAVVGITQEQHPDRLALFSQWQQLDWPILWDPFNLTDSEVVPVVIGIDEFGTVREIGLRDLDAFLEAEFEKPDAQERADPGIRKPEEGAKLEVPADAISRMLWAPREARGFNAAVDLLAAHAHRADASPRDRFRHGVALRMRYDSNARQVDDFQKSIDAWRAALALRPSQYIWRRRIQQWGPRLDKPYPFYGWTQEAREDLIARGEEPHVLPVKLTTSELSGREAPELTKAGGEHPDPKRGVPRDRALWVAVENAVAPHTGARREGEPRAVQVHLVMRPSVAHAVHWSNDGGSTEVWIENAEEWGLEAPGFVLPIPQESERSTETRTFDFMITPSARAGEELRGTVFYYVCGDQDDECRFLAQDFAIQFENEE